MVTEVTISSNDGDLILGIKGQRIIYKINGQKINYNPLEGERVILYSKREDGGRNLNGGVSLTEEEISFIPKIDYYPIICRNNYQEIPGRIISIEEKVS